MLIWFCYASFSKLVPLCSIFKKYGAFCYVVGVKLDSGCWQKSAVPVPYLYTRWESFADIANRVKHQKIKSMLHGAVQHYKLYRKKRQWFCQDLAPLIWMRPFPWCCYFVYLQSKPNFLSWHCLNQAIGAGSGLQLFCYRGWGCRADPSLFFALRIFHLEYE